MELLTDKQVAALLQIGRRTVWKWASSGHLPSPVKIGPGRNLARWRKSDIEEYQNGLDEKAR